jgi:hypothetical protein
MAGTTPNKRSWQQKVKQQQMQTSATTMAKQSKITKQYYYSSV